MDTKLSKGFRLMVPGPVELRPEVLHEMASQPSIHYGEEWLRAYEELINDLQCVFQTKNDVFPLVGPGTAALEAAFGSLFAPGERILIPTNGFFGERLATIAHALRLDVRRLQGPIHMALEADLIAELLNRGEEFAGIAMVHHETSTGVANPVQQIASLAQNRG